MSNLTRIISFVVGIIIIIFLFVLISSRLSANRTATTSPFARITPTKVPTATLTPNPTAKKSGFDLFAIFRRNTPTPNPTTASVAGMNQQILTPPSTTPTRVPSATRVPTPTLTFDQQIKATMGRLQGVSPTPGNVIRPTPTQIPKTGFPTEAIPAIVTALGAGMYLRKRT
jgi:hypothetical protein